MKIYIGIDKDEELIYLEWDKINNIERKTFSLSGGSYREPITEEEGEERAREVLENGDYWEDLGYINKEMPYVLKNHINFSDVAEEVLNVDGWQNINGEYEEFGTYKDKIYYFNVSSGGQHKIEIKDFKVLFVDKKDLKEVYNLWDNEHLKSLKETTKQVLINFFDKYKSLCSEQQALNLFMKEIEK